LGKASATFDKPVVQRLNAWMGVFGFIVGKKRLVTKLPQSDFLSSFRIGVLFDSAHVVWQGG
jgi:hypothetical protein